MSNHFDDSLTLAEAHSRLSGRESEILNKIIEDRKNIGIANELGISKKTVENHITNICRKLNMSKRGELREWAKKQRPIGSNL